MNRQSLSCVVFALALAAGVAGASETGDGPANRLASETSPYLRLHAHNPVDWYPWGEEALSRARRENRPIFLSVGYSTCYWCHVMEREVFSDPEIAELMNKWFVNVKVDREERPELDEIYMTATQLLTRRGGWPNSVFLTPDLEPFFAGTYFPPEDRGGRPGFPTVLRAIERAWRERQSDVEAQARHTAAAVRRTLAAGRTAADRVPGADAARQAVDRLKARYDADWGGFGQGQKFPSPSSLFLLWEHGEAGDAEARSMVLDTLRSMGRGAIYDQIGGGFHRYTLDRAWRVPHFEKMLYDNAHLGELLAETATATGEAELERLARGTFDFVLETMRLPNGAFKSAIDAETDAVEGAFYVWTGEEVEAALDEEGYELLAPIFGFDREPNFEHGRHTVYLTEGLATHAKRLRLSWAALLERLEPHLTRLDKVRARREFPLVDEKVLTDWNGMMIAALARGGQLLREESYVEAAAAAAEFVLGLRDPGDGTLLHVWHEGEARIPAFLDDYAFLIRGLLALEEATGKRRWLESARELADELHQRLAGPAGGYYQAAAADDLLLRPLTANDGAIPSGNGIMALELRRLAERTGDLRYGRRADELLKLFSGDLAAYPGGLATVAWAVLRHDAMAAGGGDDPTGLARSVVSSRATAADTGADDPDWTAFDLELTLAEGWHVNANPASEPFLIPTRVDGAVRDLAYPPGESFRFAFAEGEISVYSGRVRIRGESRAGEALQLTYQACDDRRCLPPVTRELVLE